MSRVYYKSYDNATEKKHSPR